MQQYKVIKVPSIGERITWENGKMKVPDNPIIPVIEGDGIGPDIMKATRLVVDKTLEKLYQGRKKIAWMDVYAGESAQSKYEGNILPEETIDAIKYFHVALKGPLTTPVGGGFRSLNVALRQIMDLYACVRPVRYYKGVVSPVTEPEKLNVVIFRENTEDVYAGIEWAKDTKEAVSIINFIKDRFNVSIREDSGIGIKPISLTASKRLVSMAIKYAINQKKSSVTLVHKGNIQKYTEGAFRDWGYELARNEFADFTITEEELNTKFSGRLPSGKILVNDRIADNMFQQILIRPDEYNVLATTNLNGDYLSDACAAQVGGLGMAPGANIGDTIAVFEATHGTAPKYANQDKVNPSSLILSAVMLLEHIGLNEAGKAIETALEKTILQKKVTYDLARLMNNVEPIKTSEFAKAIIENI